jgi:hypothetical protein
MVMREIVKLSSNRVGAGCYKSESRLHKREPSRVPGAK